MKKLILVGTLVGLIPPALIALTLVVISQVTTPQPPPPTFWFYYIPGCILGTIFTLRLRGHPSKH